MHRSAVIVLTILTAVGCSPWPVRGDGAEGRLRYSLHTDTSVDERLDRVAIVTGAQQTIDAYLTWPASWFADADDPFSHDLTGTCDAEWYEARDEPDDLPTLYTTVFSPGGCTLETWREDKLYDSIDLRFEDIRAMDVEVRVTWPDGESSELLEEPPETLPVGSSVSLEPVPLGADGAVLAGENEIELEIDTWGGVEVDWLDQLFGSPYHLDEPGLVSFRFLDAGSGVEVRVGFVVVEG